LSCEEAAYPNVLHPKLDLEKVGQRPSYSDFLGWANRPGLQADDVTILANSDIYFDESISALGIALRPGQCAALARWNVQSGSEPILNDRNDSQDAWVFKGPIREIRGDYCVGVPRCDNRFLYELKQAGYEIINPAFSIRAYHLHAGQRGEYQTENQQHFVDPPYAYLWPHNLWSLPRTLVHNLRHPQARVSWRFDKRKLMASIPLRALKKAWSLVRPANRSAAQKH
jgi:hypothetical protein